MKFEMFKSDKNEQWYWRLKADNGLTIADSGEGYVNKADCEHGIALVKSASSAPIEEVDR